MRYGLLAHVRLAGCSGLNMGRYMDLPAPVMCVDPEDSHYSQIALGADFGFGE